MHLRLGEAEARVVHMGEDLRSSVPGSPLLASTAWVSTPGKLQQGMAVKSWLNVAITWLSTPGKLQQGMAVKSWLYVAITWLSTSG